MKPVKLPKPEKEKKVKEPKPIKIHPAPIYSTTPVVNHESDCFTIGGDTDGECFSVSSGEPECFWINRGEDEKEQKIPFKDEIDFGELGFTEIKCIQAHGLNELVIIAKYQKTDIDPIEEVIAKVNYSPSVVGGIGKLAGISYLTSLSDFDITYNEVDRLDGFDIESSLSNICIVCSDNTVIWIEGNMFSEYGRVTDVNAVNDPYYDEDTYSISSYSSTVTIAPFLKRYELQWWGGCEESTPRLPYTNPWALDFDLPKYSCKGTEVGSFIEHINYDDGYDFPYGKIQTKSQTDGHLIKTDAGVNVTKYIGTTNTDTCTDTTCGDCSQYDGYTFENKGQITLKRGSKVVYTSANLVYFNPSGLSPSVSHSRGSSVHINCPAQGGGDTITYGNWQSTSCGVALGDEDLNFAVSGVKFCIDSEYIANAGGGVFTFSKIDGSNKGAINSAGNATMYSGVCIIADGSNLIKQELLKDNFDTP